ncbi:MAG: cadherin domain-containing protein [Bacteroidales bacterium]|nr:cadherin domain-containing protein [Bacteroidales bacterium]
MRDKAIVETSTDYKIKLRFLVLTILLVVFYTSLLFSATIYIDPTNTTTGQNGTIQNPYNSWNQVSFVNGNVYLQKRGTTFNTSGEIAFTGRTNITLGAYGTGNRPRIVSSGSGYIVSLTSASNCIIQDLEISSSGNATSAIMIDGYGTAISANNLISNCELHSCEWGIRIISQAPGNRILNCTVHNTGDDGIYAKDILDIEIGYCNVYDVNMKYFINPDQSYSPGDCIQLVSLYDLDFNIHHNTLDHSSSGNKFCFIVAGETYTGLVEYNTMIGNAGSVTSCLYFGHTSGTVTVRYNTIQDGNYGIYSYVYNLQLHYNKIMRNYQGVTVMSNHNLTALNNVFYNNTTASISSISNTSVTSKNNIFYLTGSTSRAYSCNSTIISNYNNFNTQQSNFLNSYSTLASWQSGTGNDLNSFIANPLFVNPAIDNLCLQSNSPCVNTGSNANLSADFYGTLVPQGNNPDIGHHEYINNQGGTNLAPVINNQSFQINENSANGTTVGTVTASDPNAGQTLTFSITSGNTNSACSINSSTGTLTVANSQALNYETITSFPLVVRATDNGTGNLWSQATVTVNLSNVNEYPVIANQSFSVVQNAANGTIVGTVTATDPDAGQTLTYSITAGNTGTAFAINASTGRITVATSSAVVAGTINLTVRATDNGSPVRYSAATVTITITSTNLAPVISNQAFSLVQYSANGTVAGNVVATDPNAGQTLTYAITAGNTGNAFSINAQTGSITVSNSTALSPQTFSLTVRVTDNGSPSLYSQATITISVTTPPNQAPVISNQSFSLVQYSPNGTVAGTMTATDPNAGQTITYSITGGNTSSAFSINPGTGVITVINSSVLSPRTFYLTVRATDNGSPVLYSQATATIVITTPPNQAPVISNQSFSVTGNAATGTMIGTVVATDPNAGQTLSYTITAGNTSNAFALNSSNGNLTVASSTALNPGTYTLTVRATDNGSPSMWSQASITITAVQASNLAPVIANQSFSVNENAAYGIQVGTVAATDPNVGQTLTYSIISGNSNNVFAINTTNGNLVVNNPLALNFEYIPAYSLIIRVTDNGTGNLWSQATITVNVNNLNESPALNPVTFSVTQFAPNGTLVGTATGSDPDVGQLLNYQIISGNTSVAFSINANNGAISVINAQALNVNLNPVFYLTVRCQDNGQPSLYSQAIITINITAPPANQPPVIANQTFSANENIPNGTQIGTIVAVDPDQGQSLTYSITSGNTNNAFLLNSSTGILTVNNSLVINYEYISEFSLTVRVTDNGTGNLWSQATITVNLNNLNEAPVLNLNTFNVNQFAPNGTFVGVINGSDPDLGQTVTYQIISGNTSNAFNLNSSNGALNVVNSSALNINVNPVFYLTVRIQDNGQPSLYSTGIFRIDVVANKNELVATDNPWSTEEELPEFILYPNPTTDGLFRIKSDSEIEHADIQIFNTAGGLISDSSYGSGKITRIDLSAQPVGIYIVKILSGNRVASYKLIKN